MKWLLFFGFLGSTLGQVTGGGGEQQVFDWVQYGVLGGVVVSMLLGWMTPKPATHRLEVDKRRAEDRRDALVDSFQRDVIPALVEFNRVADALLPLLQRLVESELRRDRRGD